MYTKSLKTEVTGINFETPLILASGYITETPDFFLAAQKYGCAGMVTRSLKKDVPKERSRVPSPRYVVSGLDYMLNCEWGNDRPWTEWKNKGVQKIQVKNAPLIISLSGRDIDSCKFLIKEFDKLKVSGFEINISCSHSGSLHGNLNIDSENLKEILKKTRGLTKRPIWIKLSYSPSVVDMAKIAEDNGADAIVCSNTIGPGLAIDVESTRLKLGIKNGAGGVSGKAIFPISLRCVYEISKTVKIPVVGVGGIVSTEDVLQMMMAGASAVQLYTLPALYGPESFLKICRGLDDFLLKHRQYSNIHDIIKLAHKWGDSHQFKSPKPEIDSKRCTGCLKCMRACVFGGIKIIKTKPSVTKNCVSCNACVGVCPTGAVTAHF